ncbi:fimbrial protein YehD [Citrobacter amalonaticus]|nr:fimbrial protein YehD [Citrobacter amalonaticus]
MKCTIISAALLSSFFMGANAFAAGPDDSGILEITGRIVGTTCQFVDGNSAEINLNDVGANVFNNMNAGDIYSGVTQGTSVPLKIQCEPGKVPHISFSTTQFDGNDITLNNGSATGVGFAVFYGDVNKQVSPNSTDPDKAIILTPTTDGVYNLNFLARYARTTGTVNAGDVKSTLTLTVVTE